MGVLAGTDAQIVLTARDEFVEYAPSFPRPFERQYGGKTTK